MNDTIKPTPKLLTIMSALATGWLPWGIEWKPELPLCGPVEKGDVAEFILCCGHALTIDEFFDLQRADLLKEGSLDKHGRVTAVITDAGRAWLEQNWIS